MNSRCSEGFAIMREKRKKGPKLQLEDLRRSKNDTNVTKPFRGLKRHFH